MKDDHNYSHIICAVNESTDENETSVPTINRRLPVLTAAPGVQRARYFPPLSRVGRGIEAMKSIENRAWRSRNEPNVSCDSAEKPPSRFLSLSIESTLTSDDIAF